MSQFLTDAAAWRELLSNDFNRGYLTGVALMLVLVLLALLGRIVLGLIFRTRKARAIVVAADDGDVQIAQEAIASALSAMLVDFPELVLDSLKIFRRGKHRYHLLLQCRFHATGKTFPDVAAKAKNAFFQGLEKQFGIDNLRQIRIELTSWTPKDDAAAGSGKTSAVSFDDSPENESDEL